jgi:hypothetical protein
VEELGYRDQERVPNLEYGMWVEQQGRTSEEIQAQWCDRAYWHTIQHQVDKIDELTEQLNEMTGLL